MSTPISNGGFQCPGMPFGSTFTLGGSQGAFAMAVPNSAAAGPGAGGTGFQGDVSSSGIVKLIAFGDVHSRWRAPQRILSHEFPEGNGTALAVGDLVTYPKVENGNSLIFVHGNHEDFRRIARLAEQRGTAGQPYYPLFAGDIVRIGGLNIAGIPGIYEPSTYTSAQDGSSMYITDQAVNAMLRMEKSVDILLMHDAPSGIGFCTRSGSRNPGVEYLADIIRHLRPRLVLFGHHHRRFFGRLDSTYIIGLDYPNRSYLAIEYDPATDKITAAEHTATFSPHPNVGYRYSWQRNTTRCARPLPLVDAERIPVGREQDMLTTLKRDHYEHILAKLKGQIFDYIKDQPEMISQDLDHVAMIRAAMALNRALPFAARCAVRIEDRSMDDDYLKREFDEMCKGLANIEANETIYAFREFLNALGLVQD